MGRQPGRHGLRGDGPPLPDSGALSERRLPVGLDPLDGSSNIDVNVSVGTIFSVLRCPSEYLNQNDTLREEAFLQPGTTQVAAGYAIYGPQTMLMLTLGNGVKGFTLTASWAASSSPTTTSACRKAPPSSPSTCPTSATGKRR